MKIYIVMMCIILSHRGMCHMHVSTYIIYIFCLFSANKKITQRILLYSMTWSRYLCRSELARLGVWNYYKYVEF